MPTLKILPWSYSPRGRSRGLSHFRVVEEFQPGAFESKCHHDKRSEAEACIARRQSGQIGCIKYADLRAAEGV